MHVCEAEAASDQATVAKQSAHLLGQRVGCDVEVLRTDAQEQVADAATDEERLITGILEAIQHLERGR